MDRRLLAEDLIEPGWVERSDLLRVEVAEPLLQLERAVKGLLDGDLLIQREPDQQRQRALRQEPVGLGIAGEVDRCRCGGHSAILRVPHSGYWTIISRQSRLYI